MPAGEWRDSLTLKSFVGSASQRAEFGIGDIIILVAVLALIFGALQLALNAPAVIAGPAINLAPTALPFYAVLSVARLAAAYIISIIFSLSYGYAAARSSTASQGLLPLLDVLQSVPILSFLPVALVSLNAILPEAIASELASIFLIFTSMAWNLTFSAYQSFSTIPRDLLEASESFQLQPWLRFRLVELPFAMRTLIWNSLLSWAGGWFFLMAAETFVVGKRDFRLPGIGSYLQAAAQAGDNGAIAWGVVALIITVVALDQILWRPALAWAERFRIGTVDPDELTRSWLYDLLSRSWLIEQFLARIWRPLGDAFDRALLRLRPPRTAGERQEYRRRRGFGLALAVLIGVALGYGAFRALLFLAQLPAGEWLRILAGLGATAVRVAIAVALGTLWTVPAGVSIGTNRRVAFVALPITQVIASIPATALFPVFVVAFVGLAGPLGLNLAAILLMLLGTQWYTLFNVIAGAAAIPRDLAYIAQMLGLGPRLAWTTLILPALYPYLITGLITASGGAWNASIVAEFAQIAGQPRQVVGIGAVIADATARGDYVLLFAATLALIIAVVIINRLLWNRLYAQATERYRLE